MAENGRHVVSLPVGAGWWHSPKSEWDNSQDGADARLIAAAPDLLAALQECASELAVIIEANFDAVKRHPGLLQRYERDMGPVHRARAAVAKATGAA
jgi:hypothetical protein